MRGLFVPDEGSISVLAHFQAGIVHGKYVFHRGHFQQIVVAGRENIAAAGLHDGNHFSGGGNAILSGAVDQLIDRIDGAVKDHLIAVICFEVGWLHPLIYRLKALHSVDAAPMHAGNQLLEATAAVHLRE